MPCSRSQCHETSRPGDERIGVINKALDHQFIVHCRQKFEAGEKLWQHPAVAPFTLLEVEPEILFLTVKFCQAPFCKAPECFDAVDAG